MEGDGLEKGAGVTNSPRTPFVIRQTGFVDMIEIMNKLWRAQKQLTQELVHDFDHVDWTITRPIEIMNKLLSELLLRTPELVHGFRSCGLRNPDRAGLIRDGTRDGLADPPNGVRGEFVTATVFELLDTFHQADVAFLDQIEE